MLDFTNIFLVIYLTYKNILRARAKEENTVLYASLTVLLFFVFWIIGMGVVVAFFCRGVVDMQRLAIDEKYKKEAADLLGQAFLANPLHPLTATLFALGGYLIVRYILDRKPEKKRKMDLWPDNESAN